MIASTDYVSSWKSKGLSSESIKPYTSDKSLTSALNYYDTKTTIKVIASCLKQPKISYNHGKVVDIYIVYELDASSSHINDPTLKSSLISAVTLTKSDDIDKYGYSGDGIEFDRRSSYSFPSGGFGQNIIISGVDMSFSARTDNKKSCISFWKRTTQGLEHTLTAEKCILLLLQ